MFNTATTVLAIVSLAAAQDQITLLVPGFYQPLDAIALGSVIATDATATTYSLACPPSATATDSDSGVGDDCGFPPSFTYTQGPSTLAYTYDSDDTDATESVNLQCQITSSTEGSCTGTFIYQISGPAVTSTASTSFSSTDIGGLTVILTDSAALAAGATATAAGSTTTAGLNTESSSSSGTTSASKTSTGGSSTGSAESAASSKASTGGMPMITGAPWIVGGAAAAVAYAAM